MAVPASERGESRFQVLLDTKHLATHTLRITANKKVFADDVHPSLVVDIAETAKNIHVNASIANSIRVSDRDSCVQRLTLQRIAIADSVRLIELIQLSVPLFHLPGRRVHYWGAIALEVRNSLVSWHNSDKKRYKEHL